MANEVPFCEFHANSLDHLFGRVFTVSFTCAVLV